VLQCVRNVRRHMIGEGVSVMCCSVLQCVAVCAKCAPSYDRRRGVCNVLQYVAVCCSVLQCVAVCAKS